MIDEEISLVRRLRFANLTPPILQQMRQSPWTWRSLVDIGRSLKEISGQPKNPPKTKWLPPMEAGSLELRISRRHKVNAELHFWSKPNVCGPDILRNKRLMVHGVRLPETLMAACRGKLVNDVVDPDRVHHVFSSEMVMIAEEKELGITLHLDMPFIQINREDIHCLIEQHEKGIPVKG